MIQKSLKFVQVSLCDPFCLQQRMHHFHRSDFPSLRIILQICLPGKKRSLISRINLSIHGSPCYLDQFLFQKKLQTSAHCWHL